MEEELRNKQESEAAQEEHGSEERVEEKQRVN